MSLDSPIRDGRGREDSESARAIYRFGEFVLSLSDHRLSRNGDHIPLRPKSFDVLVLLVRNHGHLVTREELARGGLARHPRHGADPQSQHLGGAAGAGVSQGSFATHQDRAEARLRVRGRRHRAYAGRGGHANDRTRTRAAAPGRRRCARGGTRREPRVVGGPAGPGGRDPPARPPDDGSGIRDLAHLLSRRRPGGLPAHRRGRGRDLREADRRGDGGAPDLRSGARSRPFVVS